MLLDDGLVLKVQEVNVEQLVEEAVGHRKDKVKPSPIRKSVVAKQVTVSSSTSMPSTKIERAPTVVALDLQLVDPAVLAQQPVAR